MEDYHTPDDFAEEINTAARKRKHWRRTKQKKPKWKSGEIDTLIDELEKRSCLWDVFHKDYHNREKREVTYTELEDVLKHTKKDIKTKIAGNLVAKLPKQTPGSQDKQPVKNTGVLR